MLKLAALTSSPYSKLSIREIQLPTTCQSFSASLSTCRCVGYYKFANIYDYYNKQQCINDIMHFFKKSILTYSLSLCSLSFPENPLETLGHAQFPVLLLPIVLRPSPLKLSTVTAPLKLLLSRTSAASGYKIQRPIFIFTQPHSSIFSQFTLFITNSFLVLACQITYEVR